MEKTIRGLLAIAVCILAVTASANAAESLSPYLKVGVSDGAAKDIAQKVKDALKAGNFEVIGEYSPEGKTTMTVIAYTRKDLQDVALKVKDRGFLAAILKVGLKENDGKTTVSMVNPEYLFRAYLMKNYAANQDALKKVADDARAALQAIGGEFSPFGGTLSVEELQHYHYMMGMEYFNDPVVLKKFASFEEGVQIITKNLSANKGNTVSVYTLVNGESKTAVFGVGLTDPKAGEGFFLPIIGEDHLAALPYEIILSDKVATMLHGRFRIALHWPALTMGTFTKIISTPGEIETTLKGVADETKQGGKPQGSGK